MLIIAYGSIFAKAALSLEFYICHHIVVFINSLLIKLKILILGIMSAFFSLNSEHFLL